MAKHPIISSQSLGTQWPTMDPFLFCAYHDDTYPRGNAELGPDAPLTGRTIGQDFAGKDGWRMYHGTTVAGFPAHPHRGFETVTIVRQGLIDHSDSLGATARFGGGDVQWLTAGRGIVHAEMFPLLDRVQPNPLELFQIWLNLPASHKMVAPHFTMFWSEQLARYQSGAGAQVACIAGALGEASPLPPPPDSWAAQAHADVAIWTITLAPGCRWTLPAAAGAQTRRSLYFFRGTELAIGGQSLRQHAAMELRCDSDLELVNGSTASELLMLQGRPIAEAVVQHGPFVMNSQAEIHQAFADYRQTQFGGWPWADSAPIHGPQARRFARHTDGRSEAFDIQTKPQERTA